MPQKALSEFALRFHELCGTLQCRKLGSKVEVEAGVDSSFSGNRCCSFRILHEDHGTNRRYAPAKYAFQCALRSLMILPPIVCIYNDHSDNISIQRPRSDEHLVRTPFPLSTFACSRAYGSPDPQYRHP